MSENGSGPAPVPRLKVRYTEELVPAMMNEFAYKNVMQVPRLLKIAVNIGLGKLYKTAAQLRPRRMI